MDQPAPCELREPSVDIAALLNSDLQNYSPPTLSHDEILNLRSREFDMWKCTDLQLTTQIEFMIHDLQLMSLLPSASTLRHFLLCVRDHYNPNPFHNFVHAFCVTQMMYVLLNLNGGYLRQALTLVEQLSLMLSCVCHDLDHPGFNNHFQTSAQTTLAMLYNDMSPLENHHCALTFSLIKHTRLLDSIILLDDQLQVRRIILDCILATDMVHQPHILATMRSYLPTFNIDTPTHRQSLRLMLMKAADISVEVRPLQIAERWVDSLFEEFHLQTDVEKAMGLPVLKHMDRDGANTADNQIGFIGNILLPLYETLTKVLKLSEQDLLAHIRQSLAYYTRMKDEEVK